MQLGFVNFNTEEKKIYIQDRSAISGVEKDIPLCMTQRFW